MSTVRPRWEENFRWWIHSLPDVQFECAVLLMQQEVLRRARVLNRIDAYPPESGDNQPWTEPPGTVHTP